MFFFFSDISYFKEFVNFYWFIVHVQVLHWTVLVTVLFGLLR